MSTETGTLAPKPRLDVQRPLFDIPEPVAYLNCANMSPQLRTVTDAGMAAVQHKAAPWMLRPEEWFAPAERLRALFAAVINADADGIALVPSVSYGITLAAANLEVSRGQSIVLLEGEFPSNVYAWQELARRRGAVIRTVTREATGTWTDSVLAAIRSDTAVVSVPNCHWTDGRLVDLARVGPAARCVGAALVVDASQSAGAYPLDVSRIEPDFLVTVGYKWLLGPYGLGYLYAAPRWRSSGAPLEHSWLTRAGAEDFTRLTGYSDTYRDGARRFDMGEFPQFVLSAMAIAALGQVLAWGVDRIQVMTAALTLRAEQGAAESGATVVPQRDRVGHLIGIRPRSGVRSSLLAALSAENIYVSVRDHAIRVAPHVYNTEADILRLLAVLHADADQS